jgi:hypothetical protein
VGATYAGSDEDLIDFVVSHNLHRRHLTDSQRSMVGGRIATLKQGRPSQPNEIIGEKKVSSDTLTSKPVHTSPTVADAASITNVSPMGVKRARKVITQGIPELAKAVDAGEVSVAAAAKLADLPAKEQAKQLKNHKARLAKSTQVPIRLAQQRTTSGRWSGRAVR